MTIRMRVTYANCGMRQEGLPLTAFKKLIEAGYGDRLSEEIYGKEKFCIFTAAHIHELQRLNDSLEEYYLLYDFKEITSVDNKYFLENRIDGTVEVYEGYLS
jgi:hypothetical protein